MIFFVISRLASPWNTNYHISCHRVAQINSRLVQSVLQTSRTQTVLAGPGEEDCSAAWGAGGGRCCSLIRIHIWNCSPAIPVCISYWIYSEISSGRENLGRIHEKRQIADHACNNSADLPCWWSFQAFHQSRVLVNIFIITNSQPQATSSITSGIIWNGMIIEFSIVMFESHTESLSVTKSWLHRSSPRGGQITVSQLVSS